jgi:plasmid stabilization system protein ParE
MKRRRVIISFKARNSLREFHSFLMQKVSKEIADYVIKGILQRCRQLGNFSGFSKEYYLEELPGEYRSVTQWSYKIIYKLEMEEIRVLNIIHTSRDPENFKDI